MKIIAKFAMRGRFQAAAVASLFAVLSFILPPLGAISGGLIALVTLRRGNREGLTIALAAAIVMGLVTQVSAGSMAVGGIFAVMFWLPVWLLSVVLRKTVSLMLTVSIAALLGVIFVFVFHALTGDTVAWWAVMIDQVIKQAFAQSGADVTQLEMMRESMARFMTGLMAAFFFLSMVLSLFLGRWWQAVLFNPGGFKEEFHVFRLDKNAAVVGSLILLWAMFSGGAGSIAVDLSFVVSAFGSVAGIALIHHWISAKSKSANWLSGMYLLLAFIAPQLLMLLAIVGFADAWLDLRRFYTEKKV